MIRRRFNIWIPGALKKASPYDASAGGSSIMTQTDFSKLRKEDGSQHFG